MKTRLAPRTAAAAAMAMMLLGAVAADAQDKVKIGYAIAKSGPNAAGAGITTAPNYKLWISEINAAGGLSVKGRKVPIEVIEYDDRSQTEELIRLTERLINQDKVDFILSPWGTASNLAVAPLYNRAGYPMLAATAATNAIPDMVKRFPNMFFFLGLSSSYAEGLATLLKDLRDKGQIGNSVALTGVADQFGIEMLGAARPALKNAGFNLVMDKTYPLGSQDLGAIITEASRLNPDAFVAFSYPPDTIGLTNQAKTLNFNPKAYYTAVATAFPMFKNVFKEGTEGVLGIGGWNADAPAIKAYVERHKAANGGAEPDRWASSVTYASLQILQQAIDRVGVDRAAVIREIGSGTFETILGPAKLEGNQLKQQWLVGQWQGGEFYGVSPSGMAGAKPVKLPKPAWK